MKKIFLIITSAVLFAFVQSGCTHLDSKASIKLSNAEPWVILPFQNLAETPRAGERVESLLQSILKNQGVNKLAFYTKNDPGNLTLFIDDGKQLETAKNWAKAKGFRYGITGSVQEWRYKNGLDGEPAVGLTLNIIDLRKNDALLWTATASRTGWGSENLTRTTIKVLHTLLARIELKS
jgi:hypothetical protein